MVLKSNPKTLLLSFEEQKEIVSNNNNDLIEIVESAFEKKAKGSVYLPDKISHVFDDDTQNRINCMPGALLDDGLYGVKWISVFPNNPKDGYRNVTGTIILSELEHGHTLAIMDAGYLTDIRTAAVGATAAKYLAREDATTIGFIGAGQQARRHLDLIKCTRPSINKCYVSSRTDDTVMSFIKEEAELHPDIEFIECGNDYEEAVKHADIIITATSAQSDLLKARWIKDGALYIHVAGWEDEYAVANKASKIVCDDWENVKHRTQTISRMYKEGLLTDDNIYANLDEIILGNKPSRENNKEFIYFCSVGLAYIDVSFAKYIYKKALDNNLGLRYSFN